MTTVGLKMAKLGTAGLLLVLLALTGCAGGSGDGDGDGDGAREITGIVASVEATSLVDVESFVLRSDGEEFEILIDPEVTYAFPPEHLRAHAISSEPVRVEVVERGDDLYALSMEDA